VEFGIFYAGAGPWVDPVAARALAVTAEELGYDALWAIDHSAIPVGFADRYRAEGGGWSVPDDYPVADPFAWLAYAAACTSRLRLATGVVVATTRAPLVLAKEAATLALLSGGRFSLGLGAGWIEEELAAAGVVYRERLARLEDMVPLLRRAWADPVVSYAGRFTRLDGLVVEPKPPGGHVPVILGGRVDAAARRAGRLADGYFPHQRDRVELRRLFAIARDACAEAGRDPGQLELIAGGARSPADVDELEAMGVTHIVLSPRAEGIDDLRQSLLRYRTTVIDQACVKRPAGV
jgi:probable F420-dependent oxidoreductase